MRLKPSALLVLLLTVLSNSGRAQPFPGDLSLPEPRLRTLARAESYVAEGALGVARDALDSVLATDVGDAVRLRALVLHAKCNRVLGERIAADRDYEHIINLAPDAVAGVDAARDRGTLAYDRREFQQARELLTAAVHRGAALMSSQDSTRVRATVADAWYWIGKCFTQYDQRDEARWAFDSAEAAMPRNARGDAAFYERAGLAQRDGDAAGAAILYQKIIDVYPHSQLLFDARLRQAQCFIDLHKYAAATDAVSSARELLNAANEASAPHLLHVAADAESQIEYMNGEIASGAGNYVKAGVHFAKALAAPHAVVLHRSILFLLGWSAYQSGNDADAAAWFDSVIAQDLPRDIMTDRAEFLAARAALRAGHTIEGEKRLALIADNPDQAHTADANLDFALQRFRDSDYAASKRYDDRAIKRGRGTVIQARAEILKGELLLAQEQYADAATAFRAASATLMHVDTVGDSVQALRAVALSRGGYALARSGKFREAVPMLVEFLGRYAGHQNVREAEFWLAESYYNLNALQSAQEMYMRYLAIGSGSHREEALYGAGWCEFRQRRFSQSREYLSKLVKEYPRSRYAADALLREADGKYLSRDFAGAAQSYEAAAARSGSNGSHSEYAQYQVAQCYVKLDDHAKAVAAFRTFVNAHPKSALTSEAMYQIGWNLFQQKKYSESIAALRELIAASPDSNVSAKALYTIGDALYNSKNYEEALAAYDKLVESYPGSPYVDDALASEQYCLSSLGRDSLASVVVPNFVSHHADVPAAHELALKQGDVFFNAQKYGDAVKEFDGVAKRLGNTQDGATATYWMGKSYLNLGDTAHAIEALQAVTTKFPKTSITSTAMVDLARITAAHGPASSARETFEKLLSMYSATQEGANGAIDYADWLIDSVQHDTSRAIEVLNDAAKLSSTLEASARAQILLGSILAARAQTDDAAVRFAVVAQRTDGLGAEAQYRLGEAYRTAGLTGDAVTALLRVKAEYGAFDEWLTRALLSLGACYETLGQNDLARESYQTVVAFHQDDDFAIQAKAKLKKLKR